MARANLSLIFVASILTAVVLGGATPQDRGVHQVEDPPKKMVRVFEWHRDPYAFLVNAFKEIGCIPSVAHQNAAGVLNITDLSAVSEAKPFLRFAFSATGWNESADELAERTYATFESRYGEMRTAQIAPIAESDSLKGKRPFNNKPFYSSWNKGGLFQFVATGFRRAGLDQPGTFAELAVQLMPFDRETGVSATGVDWRELSPTEVLTEAFLAIGKDALEAEVTGELIVGEMNIPGHLVAPAGQAVCNAYPVTIIWCEGDGEEQHVYPTYMHRNFWDNLTTTCPASFTCPENYWYTLTISDAGCVPDPPEGTCVWISPDGPVEQINCDRVKIGSECFDETSDTINCSEVEIECGPPITGPSGCPCD